ncbi:unnamed protein product [Ixodes persulcatus]
MVAQGNSELDRSSVLAQLLQMPALACAATVSVESQKSDSLDIINVNILHYVTGYIMRHFLILLQPECVGSCFLRNRNPQLAGSHQFLRC